MTYFPINRVPTSPTITPLSLESLGSSMIINIPSAPWSGTGTWPLANLAIFVPFTLRNPTVINKFFTANAANVTNSFDLGVYSPDGARIISTGATAGSGASTIQTVSVSATTIGPGLYYLAMAVNGTTSSFIRSGSSAIFKHELGVFEQTSAYPLPSSATFATAANAGISLCGFSTTPNL